MSTITEALQEIVTIEKRIMKKRLFILDYIYRQSHIIDPHINNDGSPALITAERQSIDDLENNIIKLRQAINTANTANSITVEGVTKTIAEWLIWRREIAIERKRFLEGAYKKLKDAREIAKQKGLNVVNSGDNPEPSDMSIVVNVDEKALSDEIEEMEIILSSLDGQLSLKNATINI